MEPNLSGIFWVKMVAKNVVLGSSETYFMYIRVKGAFSLWVSLNEYGISYYQSIAKNNIVVL